MTASRAAEKRNTRAQVRRSPIYAQHCVNQPSFADPSTGEKLWDVPIATQQDVDDAVVSAQKAFEKWSLVPFEQRVEKLRKFKDLYMSHTDEMTELLKKETGKPHQFAEFEVKAVAMFIDHHLNLTIPEERDEDDEKVMTTRFTPLGVVGAICPWNFPIILSVGKMVSRLKSITLMSDSDTLPRHHAYATCTLYETLVNSKGFARLRLLLLEIRL